MSKESKQANVDLKKIGNRKYLLLPLPFPFSYCQALNKNDNSLLLLLVLKCLETA